MDFEKLPFLALIKVEFYKERKVPSGSHSINFLSSPFSVNEKSKKRLMDCRLKYPDTDFIKEKTGYETVVAFLSPDIMKNTLKLNDILYFWELDFFAEGTVIDFINRNVEL